MRTVCVHSGALRAPLRIQGDDMAHSGSREIGVKLLMGAASVGPRSTQLTPLTIIDRCVRFDSSIDYSGSQDLAQ